jgi:hypothetical protein
MDSIWLRRARAYYHEDIEKVLDFEIWEKPTVRGAKLSQRCIQNAYKDMKKLKFRGNIIDFLCYVCLLDTLQYVVRDTHTKEEILKFLDMYHFVNQVNLRVSCKLVLKDETFIEDAFKYFKTVIDEKKEKELLLTVRDYFVNFVNLFMRYDPKIFDASAAAERLISSFKSITKKD